MRRAALGPALGLALALALAAGCYSTTVDGTALRVDVAVPQGLKIDQLRFSLFAPDGGVILAPTPSPTTAGSALSSSQSQRILLDPGWAPAVLSLEVEGLAQGQVVATAEHQATPPIHAGSEVAMSVSLAPGGLPDGGTDGGTDAGTDAGSCAVGSKVSGPLCSGVAGQGHWCWELPLPMGNFMYGAWSSPECEVWSVGGGGTTLHKVGDTWTAGAVGTSAALFAVWGSSRSSIWAVGDCGSIYHWDGNTWINQSVQATCILASQGRIAFEAVGGTGPTDVWAAGLSIAGTVLYHSTDGSSWQNASPDAGNVGFFGVSLSGSTGWAVGGGDGGEHFWQRNGAMFDPAPVQATDTLFGVTAPGASDGWAVGVTQAGNGAVWRLQPGGWSNALSPAPNPSDLSTLNLFSVWETDPAHVLAAGGSFTMGGGGALFLSNGQWQLTPTAFLHAATGSPDGTLWAAGSSGSVYRGSFTPTPGLATELPQGIDPTHAYTLETITSAGGEAWVGGTGGRVMRSFGDSGVWDLYAQPSGSLIAYSFWQPGPGDVWAAGQEGFLIHTDGGGTWDRAVLPASPANPDWRGLSGRETGSGVELWLAGSNGTMAVMERVVPGSATPVTPCPLIGSPTLNSKLGAVWASDAGTVAVGEGGLVAVHQANTDAGLFCTTSRVAVANLNGVWGASPDDIWLGGTGGTVLHGTLDGGWAPLAILGGPTAADSLEAVTGYAGSRTTEVWFGGVNGVAYLYLYPSDGGWAAGQWRREVTETGNTLLGASAPGPGEVRMVGTSETILHRTP